MGSEVDKYLLSAPLPFAAMVLCVIASFLALDHFASAGQQLILGVATWLILIGACTSLGAEDRVRALLVVVVATCGEVLNSIVLGAYTYRLENLPTFVPPGHGSSSWPDSASASRTRFGAIRVSSSLLS
jgi:hypothetical protein